MTSNQYSDAWSAEYIYRVISQGSPAAAVGLAIRALQKAGCPFPHKMAKLCGLQGLLDEGAGSSWSSEDGVWYTSSATLEETCQDVRFAGEPRWNDATKSLAQHLGRLPRKARVYVLTVGETFEQVNCPSLPPTALGSRESVSIGHRRNPAHGGMVCHRWQAAAGDIPLWRDHLPELSIRIIRDGRFDLFHLVKDVTVAPTRGTAVPIPINETFSLPAGLDYYQFPLLQGAEGNELRYEAFLKDPAFPLKADVPCKLKMSFTYGDDEPYKLVFVPFDARKAGFVSVQARWQPKADSTHEDLSWPPFPPRRDWSDLTTFSSSSHLTSDLISQMEQKLDLSAVLKAASELEKARQKKYRERTCGTIKTSWLKGGYCFVETNNGDIFCHRNDFCEETTPELPSQGDTVFFDLAQDKHGRWRAENTSFTQEIPVGLDAVRRRDYVRRAVTEARNADYALRSIRFATLTAWNHGHHLGESDAPISLRRAVERTKTQGLELISRAEATGNDDPIKEAFTGVADTIFFILCSLSADAPDEVYRLINEMGSEDVLRHWRRIAYAVGDAKQERQKALFKRCLDLAASGNRVWMQILGIAIWRAANLIHEIPPKFVATICNQLLTVLEQDVKRTIREGRETKKLYISPYVVSELELCLGLLRTRESGDEGTRLILAPGSQLANRLAQVIEKIEERICESGISFCTRIALNIEKPEGLRAPDLLYALRLYLTGDSGARAIQVTGVIDDE